MSTDKPDIDADQLVGALETIDEILEELVDLLEPAGLDGIQSWILKMHGVHSKWIESVDVELYEGELCWEGFVQVFEVKHPETTRIYAWSDQATPESKIRCFSVLHTGEITSARKALRAVLTALQRAH